MPRRRRDETKAGRWSIQVGEYGSTVRIRERGRGGRVQLVFRDPERPDKSGRLPRRFIYAKSVETVRDRHGRISDKLVDLVRNEAEALAGRLLAARLTESLSSSRLTLGQGFSLYHDAEKGGMPVSTSARRHHTSARRFWELNIEPGYWNLIRPGTVENAAQKLVRKGKAPTAEKYVRCFRTVYRWLRDKAGFDMLRDPTRGIDLRKLREGHEVRRPVYRPAELAALHEVAASIDPRFEFALIWADDSGARSAALYRATRSQVNEPLDAEPTPEQAPFGWCNLPAMKHQGRALTFLTRRQRAVFDRATETYLSALEARWASEQRDYPLIPGGKFPQSGVFGTERVIHVSNTSLAQWLRQAEEAAGVPRVRRRGWHGIRRGWAEYTLDETESIEVVRDAGAWRDRTTPDAIYLAREKFTRLARSREAQEGKADE